MRIISEIMDGIMWVVVAGIAGMWIANIIVR